MQAKNVDALRAFVKEHQRDYLQSGVQASDCSLTCLQSLHANHAHIAGSQVYQTHIEAQGSFPSLLLTDASDRWQSTAVNAWQKTF